MTRCAKRRQTPFVQERYLSTRFIALILLWILSGRVFAQAPGSVCAAESTTSDFDEDLLAELRTSALCPMNAPTAGWTPASVDERLSELRLLLVKYPVIRELAVQARDHLRNIKANRSQGNLYWRENKLVFSFLGMLMSITDIRLLSLGEVCFKYGFGGTVGTSGNAATALGAVMATLNVFRTRPDFSNYLNWAAAYGTERMDAHGGALLPYQLNFISKLLRMVETEVETRETFEALFRILSRGTPSQKDQMKTILAISIEKLPSEVIPYWAAQLSRHQSEWTLRIP